MQSAIGKLSLLLHPMKEIGEESSHGFFGVAIKYMFKKILPILAVMALSAGCKSTQTQNIMNENTLQEVAGRKNFGASHALVTLPQPCVMIATWDEDKTPDVMMAAWAGQYDYKQIVISMGEHKTTDNLRLHKAFTVSFADERTVAQSDYFGIVSGHNVKNKVAEVGFTVSPSPNVDAPIVNEYPLTLECQMVSLEDGILIGEVVNMSASNEVLDENGKVDFAKLKPIVYDAASASYRAVGDIVGKAWSAGKVFEK